MKISIEHYIATNNPSEVNAMLTRRGIPAPKNLPDAIKKLRFVMAKEGNNLIKEIASIPTPYQELILSTQDKGETNSNACGCSGFNGEKTSNCSGNPKCSCSCGEKKSNQDGQAEQATAQPKQVVVVPEQQQEDKFQKVVPFVAIGLLLVITTAVLVKK